MFQRLKLFHFPIFWLSVSYESNTRKASSSRNYICTLWCMLSSQINISQEKKWNSFMIVVLRYTTIDKSPAVYRKIYVPSVVYYSNPTWRGKFSVSVITTLLMAKLKWQDNCHWSIYSVIRQINFTWFYRLCHKRQFNIMFFLIREQC
jgi:hypothetical protein